MLSFLQYLIPFSLLLGILVVIHELGHYLAARFFGVKVEVFSLGFGPKLFKFKKWDTLFCISLIPLGGYVKMFGDNPRQVLTEEEKKIGFLSQKIWPKTAIALAGPVMNFFLAIVLFMAVGIIGQKRAEPVLGDIEEKSSAFEQGFRSGDQILSIEGHSIQYWEEVHHWIQKNPEKPLAFEIQRENQNISITVAPKKESNTQLSVLSRFIGTLEGLSVASSSAHIGVPSTNSIAFQKGLRTFDEIKEIDGVPILNWRDLKQAYPSQTTAGPLKIKVDREGLSKEFEIPVSAQMTLEDLGIEKTSLYIDRVKPGSPAQLAGLLKKDRLLALNKKTLQKWEDFSEIIKNYKEDSLQVSILREGIEKTLTLKPEKMPLVQSDGQLEYRNMIGVASAQYFSFPNTTTFRILNPLHALFYGFQQTFKWVGVTGKVLWKLVSGSISRRMLGGPLSIAQAAKRSFSESMVQFLIVMAIISINLFLMNLLPIPILDGGHILLFTIEGIKGRALSVQKIEMIQMIGFSVVLFFIVLTLFNDIQNWNIIW